MGRKVSLRPGLEPAPLGLGVTFILPPHSPCGLVCSPLIIDLSAHFLKSRVPHTMPPSFKSQPLQPLTPAPP